MQIITTIAELRSALEKDHKAAKTIGLVPTMGALHEGHLCLVREAKRFCPIVVVSIFVNPKQFGPGEDFEAYPRCLEKDVSLLEKEDVSYVFAPSAVEMWPLGNDTIVETLGLSKILQGAVRPGHFRGVTTVVAKLFNLVQPHKAFFGEKDFQQLAIIRQMVRDLAFPVEVIGVPTQREPDGLARSSRNLLLTEAERKAAPILYKALEKVDQLWKRGIHDVSALRQAIADTLCLEPLCQVETIDMRDPKTLQSLQGKIEGPLVVLLSAKFGKVRLIDQKEFSLPG